MATTEQNTTEKVPLRVAVIGSGSGGMVACHRLVSPPSTMSTPNFEVTVFEQTDTIGGTWVYEERTERDSKTDTPIHSSMYKNLRTNLPKETMSFLDYNFPTDGPSYIHHTEVLKYLNDYFDYYQLRNFVRFKTRVNRVEPLKRNGTFECIVWKVVVEDLETNCEEEFEFDAVAVCSGHYSVPRYPNLQGLKSFSGNVIHSHNYRVPEPFAGRTIACLGGGPSGSDIAMELKNVAKKVFVCHNENNTFKSPPDLIEKPFPKSCHDNRLVFEDSDPCVVDDIILCTGYDYVFPFLKDECGVTVKDNCVIPLYKQLFNAKHPTMALFGIPKAIIPFPLMDIQAQAFRKVLEGTITLPSTSEMEEDVQRELRVNLDSGRAMKHFHKMGPNAMRIYMDDLTDFAQLTTPCPRVVHKLYLHLKKSIKDLETFRDVNYGITEDDDFFLRASLNKKKNK